MRKKLIFLKLTLAICIFLVPANKINAAPAPEQFVINLEKRTCGTFFAGDEFGFRSLPEGWKVYESKSTTKIDTPYGSCIGNIVDYELFTDECCAQLNLQRTQISKIPLNNNPVSHNGESGFTCYPTSNTSSESGVMINSRTRECTSLIEMGVTKTTGRITTHSWDSNGECYITDEDWQKYSVDHFSSLDTVTKLDTPAGTCLNFNMSNYQSCCEQLNLRDVGSVDGIKTVRIIEVGERIYKIPVFPPIVYWITFLIMILMLIVIIRIKKLTQPRQQ